jgi:hypothetical protein
MSRADTAMIGIQEKGQDGGSLTLFPYGQPATFRATLVPNLIGA